MDRAETYLKVYEIDAFVAEDGGGNPAGVVFESGITEQDMQAVAAQVGFPETVFVGSCSPSTRVLRFFTPTGEIDLCGHATIAAWSLIRQLDEIAPGDFYIQETRAGRLGIQLSDDDCVFMEQPDPNFFEVCHRERVAEALGILRDDLHLVLEPQVVSTGLRDIMVPVREPSVLRRLVPDFNRITELSRLHDATSMHVFSTHILPSPVAEARNFAPIVGILEEAATGTCSGALLCYLDFYEVLPPSPTYRIEQGRDMGRLSYIEARRRGSKFWIGGRARTIGSRSVRTA